MKVRLQGDSVRLRLNRTEVATLQAGGSIHSLTRFLNGGELRIELQSAHAWHAELDAACTLRLGAPGLSAWASTDTEGLYDPTGNIAIEKDFACLHRDAAANEGTYPNPAALMKQ
jgi:hypothetical protein